MANAVLVEAVVTVASSAERAATKAWQPVISIACQDEILSIVVVTTVMSSAMRFASAAAVVVKLRYNDQRNHPWS
jgi:hypothetical protein